VIVLEAVRERQEELQVNAAATMEDLRNQMIKSSGECGGREELAYKNSYTVSRRVTDLTHLGNIRFPRPLLFTSPYHHRLR